MGQLDQLTISATGSAPTPSGRTAHAQANINTDVKLPAMEIPHFHGGYKQWSEFYDIFNTLVDANSTLSDIQKFYYLKAALKGSAADVIHSLEVSATNYQEAWTLLKERFENKKLIALSHIDSMYNFPSMRKESQADLRKFVDEIRRDLRALKSLGLKVEYWDVLLIYIFETKLDPITKKEWQKQGLMDTFATMDDFLKFLANKCAILETTSKFNNNQEDSDKGRPPRIKHEGRQSYHA